MFESSSLERNSTSHVFWSSGNRGLGWQVVFAITILLFPLVAHAAPQGTAPTAQPTTQPTSLEIYANAMKQPRVADQIAELERYLSVAENGILKQDALEVLTWDYMRMGSSDHVKQRAQQLLALDPRNPVALAGLAEGGVMLPGSPIAREHDKKGHNQRIDQAESALAALERLRRPEGMQAGDFAAMRRRAESRLNGVLGLAYVDREEYKEARTPLQQAVAVDPANPQYAYALGLALLMGKDPADQQNAFLNLARAVNLTQGTPSGNQIAEFARNQYHKAGGNDPDWNRYLAAAVTPEPRRNTATMYASAPSTVPSIANAPPGGNPAAAPNVAPPGGSTTTVAKDNTPSGANPVAGMPSTPVKPPSAAPPPLPASSTTTARASAAPPDVNVRPSPTPRPIQRPVTTPNAPLSLGILIETALLTHQNRDAIIATLKDLISHLRAEDEAAILVFSDQLDFEQDLTADDQLLEQAMSSLHPRAGKALLDGVAFAAGHLRRIGKNANRVLLVISDGRSARERGEPISAEVHGVRIYCVGLNADGADQRELLQRLASYTGGVATFASGAQDFRTATLRFTQDMGLVVR